MLVEEDGRLSLVIAFALFLKFRISRIVYHTREMWDIRYEERSDSLGRLTLTLTLTLDIYAHAVITSDLP